ncbi:MAG TPA: PilZ domain-containing protein [Deltaproteobacteria bacterium]|nr:PilZ domain-containing protein [Deltaproteobacteria bacterium]
MSEENSVEEKRKNIRKRVKIVALLKMGVYFSGRGFAKDISINGMCLVAPSLFKFMKPAQVQEYLGAPLKVMFPSQSLTVNGSLVRIDIKKGEGALSILNTSDDAQWQKICAQ